MKLSVKILPILLITVQANTDEICGIRAPGETEEDARQKAVNSLAMTINSKVSIISKSEEIIDGRKSSQKDISTREVYSELPNHQAVKYKNEFFSQACMSSEDAAKPYLDRSRGLANKIKSAFIDLRDIREKSGKKEAWENVVSIYKELSGLEHILISLNQMDMNLQREYKTYYAKAEYEYNSFVSRLDKGIYVESSDTYLESRISKLLTDYGCVLAEKEMAALHLKFVEEYEQQRPEESSFSFCKVRIEIELNGSKIVPYKNTILSPKEGETNMEIACKRATEKSVSEIWNQLKKKINIGGCK